MSRFEAQLPVPGVLRPIPLRRIEFLMKRNRRSASFPFYEFSNKSTSPDANISPNERLNIVAFIAPDVPS